MKKLRDMGLKLTPQRLAIIEYLEGNTDHPSADEIFKVISGKFPTMSFATVYNTLSALKEKGSVHELTIDSDRRRYDPNTAPHNHLICLSCRHIVDVHVDFDLKIPEDCGDDFEITGNHVEFYGYCRKCKNR